MTKCYDLQRLSERIDKMEMKILTEGMFTREDVHEIQVAMERLETRLNLTFLDAENLLKKTNILEGLKTSVEELTIFEISTEAKLANISDTLQNLKADLEKEKYENGKTRRHVINLDNTIASLTNHSKTISDNVYSIVTGLKHLSNSVSKLPLNQTIQYETHTDKDQPKGLRSCLDALHKGIKSSGIITIRSNSSKRPVKVIYFLSVLTVAHTFIFTNIVFAVCIAAVYRDYFAIKAQDMSYLVHFTPVLMDGFL